MAERVRYRTDVLEHLLVHGVRPTEHTRPELVRDFVRDLYKYEIRALRERYMRRRDGSRTEGVATYGHFRQFQVKVDEKIAPIK